jgi:hypothetical protein
MGTMLAKKSSPDDLSYHAFQHEGSSDKPSRFNCEIQVSVGVMMKMTETMKYSEHYTTHCLSQTGPYSL